MAAFLCMKDLAMNELSWISEARKHIGLRDIKGAKHNPTILAWLKYNKESTAWWRDDETPWCGLFVGHCLGKTGRYVVKTGSEPENGITLN